MEKIEKDFGSLVMENGKIYDYEGGYTGEGLVYKDYEAFQTGRGVCYMSEHELEDLHEDLTDLEAVYENSEMSEEDYWAERAEILGGRGETRESIMYHIREAYQDDYLLTDKQVEYLAYALLNEADWASISTYITDDFWIEDAILFDEERQVFSDRQVQAVEAGVYPRKYEEKM